MVIIEQHGPSGQLRDFNTIVAFSDELLSVERWTICIQECLGERAQEIECMSFPNPITFAAHELRELYAGIYQTIDGWFVGLRDGREWCRLEAVDSTSWDISGPESLEKHVLQTYGGRLGPIDEVQPCFCRRPIEGP